MHERGSKSTTAGKSVVLAPSCVLLEDCVTRDPVRGLLLLGIFEPMERLTVVQAGRVLIGGD
jgi:hypothetical protein